MGTKLTNLDIKGANKSRTQHSVRIIKRFMFTGHNLKKISEMGPP